MMKNEADWDRGLRVLLGLSLFSMTVIGPETRWGLLGLVAVVTGLAGFCPLYRLIGVHTDSVGARG
jgi:Protein of unknown function (DUF2892)